MTLIVRATAAEMMHKAATVTLRTTHIATATVNATNSKQKEREEYLPPIQRNESLNTSFGLER
jgi:hypothetical protein